MGKRMKQEMFEWQDPITGKISRCPARFLAKLAFVIGEGRENAKTAAQLLEEMQEENTSVNRRHLRAAALTSKRMGYAVISLRSTKGGYFYAKEDEEIKQYVREQQAIANSMLREADALLTMV